MVFKITGISFAWFWWYIELCDGFYLHHCGNSWSIIIQYIYIYSYTERVIEPIKKHTHTFNWHGTHLLIVFGLQRLFIEYFVFSCVFFLNSTPTQWGLADWFNSDWWGVEWCWLKFKFNVRSFWIRNTQIMFMFTFTFEFIKVLFFVIVFLKPLLYYLTFFPPQMFFLNGWLIFVVFEKKTSNFWFSR